jgi:hypothetical protein
MGSRGAGRNPVKIGVGVEGPSDLAFWKAVLNRRFRNVKFEIRNWFDQGIQREAGREISQRFLFVCVAVRELEAWFLADEEAINGLLPKAKYVAPPETETLDAEKEIKKLLHKQYGRTDYNKPDFAKRLAPRFSPQIAIERSSSLKHFWSRIRSAIESTG